MAMPQSVMIRQASLSEALTNDPQISGLGTLNHQGMQIGHASSGDTNQLLSLLCSLSLHLHRVVHRDARHYLPCSAKGEGVPTNQMNFGPYKGLSSSWFVCCNPEHCHAPCNP